MTSATLVVSTIFLLSISVVPHQNYCKVSVDEMRNQLLTTTGLSEDERDELALNMCRANPACRVLILYPRAVGHDQEIYSIIKKFGTILHEKKIYLKNHGSFNIIKQFYYDHPWFGDYGDKKSRVANKAKKTFGDQKDSPLRALLVEAYNPDYEHFRLVKVAIRDIFKTRHVAHSDHSHKVAVRMAHAVFSNPTINFFNNRGQEYLTNIEKALVEFSRWIEDNNVSFEKVCIVGDACNATYGFNDTDVIDFVYSEPLDQSLQLPDQYRNKSNYREYQAIKDSLIFDHTQHFYHRGFKFALINANAI